MGAKEQDQTKQKSNIKIIINLDPHGVTPLSEWIIGKETHYRT